MIDERIGIANILHDRGRVGVAGDGHDFIQSGMMHRRTGDKTRP